MIHRPHIQGNTWFNSKPLTEDSLKNSIILTDFWTYTCVNCLRTLPYLKEWWEKYHDKGLVIIGIHTPEFEFEKDPRNVKEAIEQLGIEWPVVLDNDYINWNNFANKYWPAKYLANKEGKIVYEHFGEGAYMETEHHIQSLLGLKKTIPSGLELEEHTHGAVCFIATPELYCGYSRGRVSNPEGYVDDAIAEYVRPEPMQEDTIGLEGNFLATAEYIESQNDKSVLYLRFHATEVNLVLAPVEKRAVGQISFNGLPLERGFAGKDITDASEIIINESRMYNLLKSNERIEGILSIKLVEGSFQAFAFTFSGCEE